MSLHNTANASKSQSEFHPTWLYIKQHNVTGLKYFGMHGGADPAKYRGSGTFWKNHLKAHGNDVTTTWCQLFTSKDALVEHAIKFSSENDIVNSAEWANLIPETGLEGATKGHKSWNKGKHHTPEHIEKAAAAQRGVKKPPVSDERKEKQRAKMIGRPGRIPTEDELLRRSASRKELHLDLAGEKNPFFNKHHSDKTKETLRNLNLGKKLSPETIAKREATKLRNRLAKNSSSPSP